VLERTRQAPSDGSTHWSLHKMAAVMKEADLKPHRLDRYMASNDPQFEQKAATIIGLYRNPRKIGGILCRREKRDSSARSARPSFAAIAGASREARFRV
jgi:hypothetical protein